jgi:hypothetical protein
MFLRQATTTRRLRRKDVLGESDAKGNERASRNGRSTGNIMNREVKTNRHPERTSDDVRDGRSTVGVVNQIAATSRHPTMGRDEGRDTSAKVIMSKNGIEQRAKMTVKERRNEINVNNRMQQLLRLNLE